jgi:hypothetical protein
MGMKSVGIKNPAKSNWGTKRTGRNSCPKFGSPTLHPSKTATAVAAMARVYMMAKNRAMYMVMPRKK